MMLRVVLRMVRGNVVCRISVVSRELELELTLIPLRPGGDVG